MTGKETSGIFPVLCLGWACIAFAVLTAGTIAWQVIQQYRLLQLPLATGAMLLCEPVVTHGISNSRLTPFSGTVWTVNALYSYPVEGKSYEGHIFSQRKVQKIVNGGHPTDPPPDSLQELCSNFAAGKSVQVWYHPDAPEKSFIYFNSPFNDWVWALIPTLAALCGWFFLFAARFAVNRV